MTKGRDVPPDEPEITLQINPRRLKLRHIVALEEAMSSGVKPVVDWLIEHARPDLTDEELAAYREELLELDWLDMPRLRTVLRQTILEAGKVPQAKS